MGEVKDTWTQAFSLALAAVSLPTGGTGRGSLLPRLYSLEQLIWTPGSSTLPPLCQQHFPHSCPVTSMSLLASACPLYPPGLRAAAAGGGCLRTQLPSCALRHAAAVLPHFPHLCAR